MAVSISQVWRKTPFAIAPGETKNIDAVVFAKLQHIEYVLNFNSPSNTKSKSLNMSVKKSDTDVIETIHSLLGVLSVIVTPKIMGTNYVLEVTNNEAFALNGSFASAQL